MHQLIIANELICCTGLPLGVAVTLHLHGSIGGGGLGWMEGMGKGRVKWTMTTV